MVLHHEHGEYGTVAHPFRVLRHMANSSQNVIQVWVLEPSRGYGNFSDTSSWAGGRGVRKVTIPPPLGTIGNTGMGINAKKRSEPEGPLRKP